MIKRLIQHSKSATPAKNETPPIGLTVQPQQSESGIMASLERVNKAHGKTLEKLAKEV